MIEETAQTLTPDEQEHVGTELVRARAFIDAMRERLLQADLMSEAATAAVALSAVDDLRAALADCVGDFWLRAR